MASNELVLGFFPNEAAADAAVETLKGWDKMTAEVKLGAIGVLVADEKGQIKEHKLGARSTKKGAGIGLVLAVVAPPTLLVGLVGGGILGRFHHQGLGLKADDRERLGVDLKDGQAAVGVLVSAGQAEAVSGVGRRPAAAAAATAPRRPLRRAPGAIGRTTDRRFCRRRP